MNLAEINGAEKQYGSAKRLNGISVLDTIRSS